MQKTKETEINILRTCMFSYRRKLWVLWVLTILNSLIWV